MSFSICNGNGDSVDSPSADVMRRFIDELDPADEEHGAAWVSDEFLVFGALGVHLYLGLPGPYRGPLVFECPSRTR